MYDGSFAAGITCGALELRRARREIRVEQVGRRRRLDAAAALHRLVFGEELERHRRGAVDEFVQEDAQLLARALDRLARGLRLALREFLEARELPLDLVGERDDCVEPDHLDRARRLVDVCARVLERRQVLPGRAECRERLEAAGERLVDLALHPRQRAQVEFGCGVGRHGRSVQFPSSEQEPGLRDERGGALRP